jgi:poly-gamma-glutamate system protein
MKRIYWRPRGVSNNALLAIAGVALAAIIVVEVFPERASEAYLERMLEATDLAAEATDAIRAERTRLKIPIDPIADPAGSGIIGVAMSEITSSSGNLLAKQTTVNPNWAAVAVLLLAEAGVEEGDTVAVGISGSFPGINLSLYAAMATMRLDPIIISSISASQWGANHSQLTWPDMERVLFNKKIFPYRSAAVSLGGAADSAAGVSTVGLAQLRRASERSGLLVIEPQNYAESVVERMVHYRQAAGDRPIRAYINVGGGTSSVGTHRSKFAYQPGINRRAPPKAALIDSVMARFLDEGVPVIHFLQINRMAQRYGLPIAPQARAAIGSGQVFAQRRYNTTLAAAALALVIGSLFLFLRSGRGRLALERPPRAGADYEPTV